MKIERAEVLRSNTVPSIEIEIVVLEDKGEWYRTPSDAENRSCAALNFGDAKKMSDTTPHQLRQFGFRGLGQ